MSNSMTDDREYREWMAEEERTIDTPTALSSSYSSSIRTQRTTHVQTATSNEEKQHDVDEKLVALDEASTLRPINWPTWKKWLSIFVVSSTSTCVTCASSVVTTAYEGIMHDFHISKEVAILGLSLFVLGLGAGPLLLAPFSEFYGRRPVYIVSLLAFFLFGFPVAFANNAYVFFIFRFLTGFVGSAFLSVAGGTVSDLYTVNDAYFPMSLYTCSPFLGPILGPVYSGFSVQFSSTWRWNFRVIIIWAFAQLVLLILCAPETFEPKVLVERARQKRKETGDTSFYAQHERTLAQKSLTQTVASSASRVFLLLTLEPMLLLLCLWCAVLLGIIYLFFEFFPIVFAKHNFSTYQNGLSFLGLGVGVVIALLLMVYFARQFQREADQNGGRAPPEARLEAAKWGAVLCPIGLLIFAFTSYKHVHWIVPILASVPFGVGFQLIFCSVFTFTTDNWRSVAASAMGANSVARSTFAAVFPLFANQMAYGLTTTGAAGLLAGVNLLIVPLPFVFARYGPQLRAKSKFAL